MPNVFPSKKRVSGKRELANCQLDKRIKAVYAEHKERYGSPRMTRELRFEGERCSKHRVARQMHSLGLQAKAKRKLKVTTDSKHHFPIATNVLNRDFKAPGPDQK